MHKLQTSKAIGIHFLVDFAEIPRFSKKCFKYIDFN